MKFLKNLHSTKLEPLTLLDITYIIVILPLFLIIKIPMFIFLLFALGLIIFKKEPASNTLILSVFLLGIIALFLSMYGAFNFQGLSRLKLFLELLTYILLIVISLQRLIREINFYLKLSPMLLLALSLFFFHSLFMLVYVIVEIFVILWMILSHRTEGKLLDGFKVSMVMFMYALPWVVLLFIFFPRISFHNASYGFKGETQRKMGHDGQMFLDNKALLVPSDKIVMEVGFKKEVPMENFLYFRGSMLYIDKGDHWEPLPKYLNRTDKYGRFVKAKEIEYKVTLYPTQKKWVYLLDFPSKKLKDTKQDEDLITTVEKNLIDPLHYIGYSKLSNKMKSPLDMRIAYRALEYRKNSNPKTLKKALEIVEKFPYDEERRAKEVFRFFQSQDLTYTLKPKALDLKNATDSFLFENRRGYCVHFASSFVTMARMAQIPARIVTGYKGELTNAVNNYLAVKERNAHAWAELYLNGYWVRFETTSTASTIEREEGVQDTISGEKEKNKFLDKVNIYLMYVKYQIETWILYYSHLRQLQLLKYAKENPTFIAIFVGTFIALVFATLLSISYFRKPSCSHRALCILIPLLKRLKKKGYEREKEETLHSYFLRIVEENPKIEEKILKIDKLYEELSYSNKKDDRELKKEVKRALRLI